MDGAEKRKELRIPIGELPQEYRRFTVLLSLGTETVVKTIDASMNGFGFVSELPGENFIAGSHLVLYPVGLDHPVYGIVAHSGKIPGGTRVGVSLRHTGGYAAYAAALAGTMAGKTESERKPARFGSINFTEKFSLFTDLWSPKCVARLDDYLVKLVKIKGHFTWHSHADCDEIFIVHRGNMRIDFRNGSVVLNEGEMFVVKKGEEHKPFSENVAEIILLERSGIVNTGEARNEFTKEGEKWI